MNVSLEDNVSGGAVEDSLALRAGRFFLEYRNGNSEKMADLVHIVTPILWHTARAARLDAPTAEDVVQTVWLSLVRKADTITEPLAVLQWLVISTKREAWRLSKVQAKTRPEDSDGAVFTLLTEHTTVEDEVVAEDSQARLWRHIQALPERCRTLLRVIAFADKPDYAALARSLGMPQGSIGPTRGRCLAKLRLSLHNDPSWETR